MDRIFDHVDSGYKECIIDISGLYLFWNKLVDYATYWEKNSPTANGNPDYNTLVGFIQGFLTAKKWEMFEEPTKITIKTSQNKLLMVMTKRPIPQSYYETIKEIEDSINNLLNN